MSDAAVCAGAGKLRALRRHGICRGVCHGEKQREDAEDIAQEVFISYVKAKPAFESAEHEKAWLLRVTINRCKSFFRSAWQRKTTGLEDDFPDTPLHPRRDRRSGGGEPPAEKYRQVIYLYYIEVMPPVRSRPFDAAEHSALRAGAQNGRKTALEGSLTMYKDDYISAFGKLAPARMDDRHAGQNAPPRRAGSAGRGRAAGTARFRAKNIRACAARRCPRGGGGAAGGAGGLVLGRGDAPGGQRRPRAVQFAERRGRDGRGRRRNRRPASPQRRTQPGHGKLCGGSAGDNGGRAGRRAGEGGRAAVRREGSGMGMGMLPSDGCGPWRAQAHLTCLPGTATELPVYAVPAEKQRCARRWEDTAAKLGGTLEAFFILIPPARRTRRIAALCQRQGGRRKLFPKRAGVHFYRYEQG